MGDRVLINRELYIPEKTWFSDRQQCTEAGIPPDLEFAPAAPLQRRIRLTLAEIRGLFNNRNQEKQIIHTAMGWSVYRRQHQADARRRHFTRRLKVQYL